MASYTLEIRMHYATITPGQGRDAKCSLQSLHYSYLVLCLYYRYSSTTALLALQQQVHFVCP